MRTINHIRLVIRNILFQSIRAGNAKNIANLISKLKTEKKYLRYPFKEYPPTVANYSFFRKTDLRWFEFYYSVHGKPDPDFIPIPCYLYVETCLNDRMLTYAIKEKNFYNKYLTEIPTPATALRRINGFYYDDKFQKIDRRNIARLLGKHRKLILKPSIDSGAGNDIFVFENQNGLFSDGESDLNPEFLDRFKKDFTIQEFVTQHSFFSQFNPTCNNTIKIFVYRSINDDSVNLLHSIFWVGAKGSYLDHDDWGGLGLSINGENKINSYAIDVHGNKYESVNNIALSSLGKVPAMDEMKTLAKEIAGNIYYGRLLALDFTVDIDGNPLLLDINCWRNGVNQYQMHNGGLFKEFTKEILDYCQDYQPRFVIRI